MTYNQGYCYAYRRAWYHPAFKDLREASIWNYLYQNAAYEPTQVNINGYTFELERGQIAISISYLAKGFCMSEKGVRVVIQKLEKLGMVGKQGTSRGTILTICNYEDYQRKEKTKGEPKGNKGANRGQAKGDNINEDKEDKEDNEDKADGSKPPNVSEQTWDSFKKLRAAKKSPITDIVITRILGEADKAFVSLEEALQECCERGWTSFKADWYNKSNINLTTGVQYGKSTNNKSLESIAHALANA